jgi:hypothetical protein
MDDLAIDALVNRLRTAESNAQMEMLSLNPGLVHAATPTAPRFLFPSIPFVPTWSIDLRPTEKGKVVSAKGDDWNAGIQFTDVDAASVFADLPITADTLLLLEANLRYRASPDCRIMLETIWSNAEGKRLSSNRLVQLPVDWELSDNAQSIALRIPLIAPATAASVRIRIFVSRQYEGDFLAIESFSLAAAKD